MCKQKVLIYKHCKCPIFTGTYETSSCPIAHATHQICQAAQNANTLADPAHVEARYLCASCDKHSAASGQENGDANDHEAEEGTFSTEANDCLKRYSFEHRQAVVARSCNSKAKCRDGLTLLVKEAGQGIGGG